ncbi:VirD4-like conjugal transfer protein, CD1115 family [Paenibacillus sp. NPDC056579]|uniref:VirD4-like conjugal transfer protein, CD1115 family n=1 Tax=Paenibacillus sp. NPDC056579 TaxID=3345871 RepID=UPI0036836EFB
MQKQIQKRLIGSLLLGLVAAAVVEWFVITTLTWISRPAEERDFERITQSMWQPLKLLKEAGLHPSFWESQLIPLGIWLLAAIAVFVKFGQTRSFQEASQYGAYGTAKWASTAEVFNDRTFVKRTWNKRSSGSSDQAANSLEHPNLGNPAGLLFGTLQGKPVILPEDTAIPNRNVFGVGGPGSGKTQSYILTNIIHERNRSIVVTDPKGEIYESTASIKREQGYEVRLINFKEMDVSDRYNPIDYIEREVDAEQIATALFLNSQNGDKKMDFWGKAEIALLTTLLLYVKYECDPADANMDMVRYILTTYGRTPEDMDLFFGGLETDHPASMAYQIVRMAEDKVRSSIFISLAVTMSKWNSKTVQSFTAASDFRLEHIGEKKMIVYVILPVADSTWEMLTSNFFTQLFQQLYRLADRHYNRLPRAVNIMLDEFPNIGKIPNYEELLATCRSYGISCSTIVQSVGQLIDKYSKEKAEAIIGNHSIRFLLGAGDHLTAKTFSELLGDTTIRTDSRSVSKSHKAGGGSDSTSQSYAKRSLMTPDEIMRMPREEGLLLVSGMNPIRMRKAFQFEFFQGVLHERESRFRYPEFSGNIRRPYIPPYARIASDYEAENTGK